MESKTCCCCLSLKTGVWIIGILQIIDLFSSVSQYLVETQLIIPMVTSIITTCLFIFLFLDMMLNPEHDTLKLRNCVWITYLIGLIIIPIIITALGIIGVAFDYVSLICMKAERKMQNKDTP